MSRTRRILILILLALLPLQQAQAFFCFRFAMGGAAGSHDRFSRQAIAPRGFAGAPHPSWYLYNRPLAPLYPRPYPAPFTPITNPLAPVSTPQPGK